MTTLDQTPAEAGFVPTVLAALQAKTDLAGTATARYLCRAAMAGVIIGLLVLANYTVSAMLGGSVGRLAGAAVFGLALTFIYFSRSELTTSTMMVASVGVYYSRMRAWAALRLMGLCLLGNALGGLVVAVLVRFSTLLSGPTLEIAEHSVQTKLGYLAAGAAGYGDLFVRAIGCNLLINLAMLLVYKGTLHSEGGKIAVLWSGVFLFVVLGFEHSVANTVLFAMYGLSHGIDVLAAVVAVVVAFAGNLVGGGLLVGVTYAYLNGRRAGSAG
ncbi:MAG: formate/nitrite transporter family protein [Propionicimonas sp.]|nr:formate/nitrite transporter family protein [Propionicimonas sp.]